MKYRNVVLITIVLTILVLLVSLMKRKNPKDGAYENISAEKVVFIELDDETIAQSGFVNDVGVSQVIQNCTQCHSSKLVTQNRLSEAGWETTIEWMQKTQNLWDLGANEDRIVSYLAKNYGPVKKGRREHIEVTEWYQLNK